MLQCFALMWVHCVPPYAAHRTCREQRQMVLQYGQGLKKEPVPVFSPLRLEFKFEYTLQV